MLAVVLKNKCDRSSNLLIMCDRPSKQKLQRNTIKIAIECPKSLIACDRVNQNAIQWNSKAGKCDIYYEDCDSMTKN